MGNTLKYTIFKADPTYTAPAAEELTYNGAAQTLAKGLEPFMFADSSMDAKSVNAAEGEGSVTSLSFFMIGNIFPESCENCALPATGFSPRHFTPLSVRPDGFNYRRLDMRVQIPSLGLETELVGVPRYDGEFPVEWLGADVGVLSGSARPGEGLSVIVGHNTLNDTEYGPFALL